MATWHPAFPAAELPRGGARVVVHGDDHVAVFHADDGFYAVDARCPHEGYPLAKGDLAGCTLTCRWHNFKFDLRDGRCVVGDEAVRTYPLRIVDGRIELDLTPPPRDVAAAGLWKSLDGAIARRRTGQAARDVLRLLRLGIEPAAIAAAAARFDAARGEYGAGHALPLAADVVPIARRRAAIDGDREGAALALLPAIEMAAESGAHHPVRTVAPAAALPDDPAAAEARLGEAVAAEDAAAAEAIVRAAAARWPRAVVEPWLLDLACRHFVDFGHGLIFQVKAQELLADAGWAEAPAILPASVYGLVMGTREDLLPEWAWFRARLADVEPRLPALAALPRRAAADEVDALAATITDGSREAAFDAITAALTDRIAPARIADALVLAAAERLLRFDPAIDADPTVQDGWLDVTHVLTYASAARAALARLDRPGALRPLWFAARFVNNARALDGARPPVPAPAAIPPARGEGAVRATIAAVERRDPEAAIHHAAIAWAADAGDRLADALEDGILARGASRPIFLAHQVKTLRAARAEAALVARPAPLLAAVRFLASPLQERRAAQAVHEAARFLYDGKVPRTLT